MRYFPPAAPPKPQPTAIFHPDLAPVLANVHTDVGTLPLPPHQTFDRSPPAVVTTQAPPAPELVIDPQPVYRGGLVYPDRAVEAGVGGYVDFSFVIEPDGSVGNAQVIDEVPDGYGLAAAAKKAFPKWRFEPRFVNGVAVAAPARIRVTFKLQ
jgi:TonB family protein